MKIKRLKQCTEFVLYKISTTTNIIIRTWGLALNTIHGFAGIWTGLSCMEAYILPLPAWLTKKIQLSIFSAPKDHKNRNLSLLDGNGKSGHNNTMVKDLTWIDVYILFIKKKLFIYSFLNMQGLAIWVLIPVRKCIAHIKYADTGSSQTEVYWRQARIILSFCIGFAINFLSPCQDVK